MSPIPRKPSLERERHWYNVPGADLALMSEMKASKADLKRFRRETEWLEERVSRQKLDPATDGMLDKALGLTIKAPHQHNRTHTLQPSSSSDQVGQAKQPPPLPPPPATNSHLDRYGSVRLSSDSRIAFSQLKTNLLAETEEQTRLLTDQEILQNAVDAARASIEKNEKAKQAADARILELQRRQPEVEAELQKVIRIEKAYEEMMKHKQSQMDQEVQQLQNMLNLLRGQEHPKDEETTK
ncbi:MAG: hypothetical protein BYD32DRAFT_428212 [Podila humilis]|nr:MAG: hypothetical protein BYD32DRAFT_428212 [Podila humilis]